MFEFSRSALATLGPVAVRSVGDVELRAHDHHVGVREVAEQRDLSVDVVVRPLDNLEETSLVANRRAGDAHAGAAFVSTAGLGVAVGGGANEADAFHVECCLERVPSRKDRRRRCSHHGCEFF